MNTSEYVQQISEIFENAGRAHHQAFLDTNGEDSEWPIWYANHIYEPIKKIMPGDLTRSRIIYCLIAAEQEHHARAPETNWPDYYAKYFLECHGPAKDPKTDKLALYYFPTCPFCRLVLRTIEDLGIEVELRNIRENDQFLEELINARARGTVPVLRITSADGEDRWMPESADIVDYLSATYGKTEPA
jgi:glutaredoxin